MDGIVEVLLDKSLFFLTMFCLNFVYQRLFVFFALGLNQLFFLAVFAKVATIANMEIDVTYNNNGTFIHPDICAEFKM